MTENWQTDRKTKRDKQTDTWAAKGWSWRLLLLLALDTHVVTIVVP